MKFIDFFAGIGGFRRGMELAGHECVGFCEWDKFATASYTSMHLITEMQREFLKTLPLRERQKEILKKEYRNGEWYADDITRVTSDRIPEADCYCFGFPCQAFSIAGNRRGFEDTRGTLFFEVMRLAKERKPHVLFAENVKGLLNHEGGKTFGIIISTMDELGYDVEWQVLNSAAFGVPQNRERVFIVGYLRGTGGRGIFPVRESDQEVINIQGQRSNTITARYGTANTVGTYIAENQQHAQVSGVYTQDSEYFRKPPLPGLSRCLKANKHDAGVVIPVLTPDRIEKRQNGRRFKKEGEPMFTLTAQDRHGVIIQKPRGNNKGGVHTIAPTLTSNSWQENNILIDKAIRRLTPKECFRLQGWTDDYFEKAEFVNSDNQLYKQAGNGVTVNVVREIAEKMRLENEN